MKRINAKNIITKRTFQKKASGYVQELGSGNYLQPTVVKLSDDDCWKFFQFNEWINAVVNRIVADCVKVKPKIVPKDKSKKLEGRIGRRHRESRRFLDNPNDNKESFREIREKTIRDMLVFGRGAQEKVNSDTLKLKELYSLYGADIRVNADEHGNLPTRNAYSLESSFMLHHGKKKPVHFDINELIFMVLQPTSRSVYGLKPMDALANAIASDIMRATYNMNFFLNNGEAAGILGLEGMNKKDLRRFREYWNANFKGYQKAHKVAAVNTKVNWIRTAVTSKDMEFSEYGVELRTKIFSAYNMQPVIMGVVDKTTGKLNTKEQIQLYKDGAIRPILEKEAFYYTNEILEKGLGIYDLEFDFGAIDLADQETQARIDQADVERGIIVIDEARAHKELGPVPWGKTPINIQPGGIQVDPETGRIQGQNQDNKPSDDDNNDDDKSIERYVNSCKMKIESILENTQENFKSIEYECRAREQEVYVNGKKYSFNVNSFPYAMKHEHLYKLIDGATIPDQFIEGKIKNKFIRSLQAEIKHIVISSLKNGDANLISSKIDDAVNKFRSTELYGVLF